MKEPNCELFENSPIPLWEEDFTYIRKHLSELQRFGVIDLEDYFREHPRELPKCVGLIKVKKVNRQAIKLFKAKAKKDLLASLENVFTEETRPVFIQSLLSIARGQTEFESETVHQTLNKDRLVIKLNWSVVGDRVIVSTQDITHRKQAEKRLQEYQVKLQSLASELSLAEERERKRIAVELHDQIGQSLAISKLKLDSLRHSGVSADIAETLDEVCILLEDTIRNTTSLTYDLRSPVLDELGFGSAVETYLAEEIEKKRGIATEYENDEPYEHLSEDLRGLLFRSVREILTNTVKHAQAKHVKVSIKRADHLLHINILDDGVGFDSAQIELQATREGGFGLFSIRERLDQLGGELKIVSSPDQGCSITMVVPLQ